MQKVTSGLTISLDGFGAGLNQSFEQPFGDNFDADLLDNWMFAVIIPVTMAVTWWSTTVYKKAVA